MTPGGHVWIGAFALRLPSRDVLHVTLWEHAVRRALALGLPSRKVLYVTLDEHVLFRALALGLPSRKVLYVTLRSTLRSGRGPSNSLAGRSYA